MGATGSDVQKALNDIPTLSPNLVTVTDSLYSDGVSKVYTVTFDKDLGNVDLIRESLGLVSLTATEKQSGSPTGAKFQLKIANMTTNYFTIGDYNSVTTFLIINLLFFLLDLI